MCDYIAHRKDIQQDVEVLASPCNEWIILVPVVQEVDHSHSPLENSVSSGSTYPVNRSLSTGYHHILPKSLSIGPHHAAAILDSKRGWTGINNEHAIFRLSAFFMPVQPSFKSKMAAAWKGSMKLMYTDSVLACVLKNYEIIGIIPYNLSQFHLVWNSFFIVFFFFVLWSHWR